MSNAKLEQAISYLSSGSNYLEDLYERYLKNPNDVDPKWRNLFSSYGQGKEPIHSEIRSRFENLARQSASVENVSTQRTDSFSQMEVEKIISAYRSFGHYYAKLDPLNLTQSKHVQELEISDYSLSLQDPTLFNSDQLLKKSAKFSEIFDVLQKTYCGHIGFEYQYITQEEEREWLRQQIESVQGDPRFSKEIQRDILKKLTQAESVERYLGAKYVGQTRFSLEGGEALIPMMDLLVQLASEQSVREIVIGMGHRGRLNMLINILGKPPAEIFESFEGQHVEERSGDVKYHLGFASDIKIKTNEIHLALAFNPSHLEIVNPVIEGSVRARQDRDKDLSPEQVLPLLLHGDAAFAGQGVVMETLNMSQTRGFSTKGTLHIVINNQIGFTINNPKDARSTWYCTDIAKMIEAPVFHVNADEPEACLYVMKLALDYRMRFKKDVVIDLVCYRRYGHNEGDEPMATQPLIYQIIKQHPSVRKQYADRLINAGVVSAEEVNQMTEDYRQKIETGKPIIQTLNGTAHTQYEVDWKPYFKHDWKTPAKTGVPLKTLKAIATKIETLPEGMVLQPQVARMMEERRKMTEGEIPINWGYAETLAFATLLDQGYPIRLTGQDAQRGTFAHRHAVLHDYKTDSLYIPLDHVSEKQAPFTIIDSLLSEEAVMGFEYGYASSTPEALTIWEAQYGDFANGAQVIVDQFLSSGEQKWERLCGLVLLLPHGYEGAGPEHSSARLERYLQLCAEGNMQVCVPSTPAQIFHLLRRQMIRPYRKPLITLTPKSLLRHKLVVSSLEALEKGEFYPVLPEIDKILESKVRRVVLCCGKVYYDLLEKRREKGQEDVAILRLEQLYPFPLNLLKEALAPYKKAKEIVWCQEEPKNQGAWYSIYHSLVACLQKDQTLHYAGRKAYAAPAAGYKSLHVEQQKNLIEEALST